MPTTARASGQHRWRGAATGVVNITVCADMATAGTWVLRLYRGELRRTASATWPEPRVVLSDHRDATTGGEATGLPWGAVDLSLGGKHSRTSPSTPMEYR